MARIRPFPALRPKSELAAQICELPYDVMSSSEAKEMARGNPYSFLHVSKPEIDLDPSISLYDPQVYLKGKENFERLIQEGYLFQDAQSCFYLYRQVMGNHTQVGLVCIVSCNDYKKNIIKKHELTRPDKEDDRVRHIETLNAQTGPVFLTYQAHSPIDRFVASKIKELPLVHFTAKDGICHTAWLIANNSEITFIQREFETIPSLYVADGHHRSAAAVRIWEKRTLDTGAHQQLSSFFLAVLFPHNQIQILPYNRIVKDLHGLTPDLLIQQIRKLGDLEASSKPNPTKKHEVAIFLNGTWHLFRWKKDLITQENRTGQLDVSLLQKYILDPILGINDPRTSNRIHFVGGIRGIEELERHVRSGSWAIAFSMFPTQIKDLIEISDEGGIMPPKSTWFEPKLRDGMFCHMLEL